MGLRSNCMLELYVKTAYQHMLKTVAVLMENIQSSAWIREEMIGPWKCIKKIRWADVQLDGEMCSEANTVTS